MSWYHNIQWNGYIPSSCISLIFSPFLSAVYSSYQSALAMADIDQERDGVAIPLGKELNSMSDPTCSFCFCFSQYNAVWCHNWRVRIWVLPSVTNTMGHLSYFTNSGCGWWFCRTHIFSISGYFVQDSNKKHLSCNFRPCYCLDCCLYGHLQWAS